MGFIALAVGLAVFNFGLAMTNSLSDTLLIMGGIIILMIFPPLVLLSIKYLIYEIRNKRS